MSQCLKLSSCAVHVLLHYPIYYSFTQLYIKRSIVFEPSEFELAKFDCIFKTFPRGIFVSVFSSSDLDSGFDYRSWSIQRLNDIWCFASHATVNTVPDLPIGSIG